MIEELKRIEREELAELLANPDDWQSLDVSYHPPRVERVWRQYGDHRISLHVIHPCEPGESLIHPHPWKSAIHVFNTPNSVYEHGICVDNSCLLVVKQNKSLSQRIQIN